MMKTSEIKDKREIEKDLKRSLRYVEPFIMAIGAWPLPPQSSLCTKILQWVIRFIIIFLALFFIGPGFYYVFFKEESNKRKLQILTTYMYSLVQLIKYIIILCRMNDIRILLEEIRNDWLHSTEENRQLFRENAKIGDRVVFIVALTMYSGGLCYRIILPLTRSSVVLPNNITIRILPSQTFIPFIDEQITPNYEIIFVLQVTSGICIYTIFSGATGVIMMICLHACSLIRILTNKLVDLTDKSNTSEEIIQEKVVNIVEYHGKIKKFLSNGQLLSEYISFLELCNGTGIACLIGYTIIVEWERLNTVAIVVCFTLLTTSTFTSYTICSIGQLLLDESNNLAQTCVTLDWYRLPMKQARYVILMMIMSNDSIKLTAMKVMDITILTFSDIMKASMGYLNMLRNVT
ncbi:odorant receptor Or2-like [Bombus pascuorum]|uniref:odorant receptor Or2-like n=1 Tax=Bombus pascuorum TaxID=65598 RepID=UPI00298DCBD7|nr:odorant receptor Or2-like [Bombus pascuorum]